MKCRNCSNKKTKLLFTKGDVPYFKCSSCHIWFSAKLLDDESAKQLYKYYSTSKSVVSTELNELRYDTLLSKLDCYRTTSRLLDVGCGRGDLLRIANKKGWEAIGSEFSQEAMEHCKKNNLKVLSGKLSEIDFPADYFDVICMQEVIEHVDENPKKFLNEVFRILRPGGALYLTTPNLDSLTRRLLGAQWQSFHIEHRFLFTPDVLKGMLNKVGFRICVCETKNISLNEIKEKIFSRNLKENTLIRQEEQTLRKRLEKNKFLKFLKYFINQFLNISKCGDTISVLAEKIKKSNNIWVSY